MPIHRNKNIAYYTFKELDQLGVPHGIFMRHGGCSTEPWESLNLATSVGDSRETVIENRNRMMDTLGRDRDSIYDVWQVHSSTVIFSNKPRKISVEHKKADAIITSNNAISLLMLFADCVPIFLYDKKANIAAIAHAGWKGTVNKVVGAAVGQMIDQNDCSVDNMIACIGPSICVDHYSIGPEVVAEVKNAFGDASQILIKKEDKFHLNLQQANRQTLLETGVSNISLSGICTACHISDWFSHRAENGNAGRFGAVMACK